jgi:hypothetical protein
MTRETLNKSAFYSEPAQRCDAGISKKILGSTELAKKVSAFI